MKKFTNKKIKNAFKDMPSAPDYAAVLEDGTLYIHNRGEAILQSVYERREQYCDVTEYVNSYLVGENNKENTVQMIREAAEIFYSGR